MTAQDTPGFVTMGDRPDLLLLILKLFPDSLQAGVGIPETDQIKESR